MYKQYYIIRIIIFPTVNVGVCDTHQVLVQRLNAHRRGADTSERCASLAHGLGAPGASLHKYMYVYIYISKSISYELNYV